MNGQREKLSALNVLIDWFTYQVSKKADSERFLGLLLMKGEGRKQNQEKTEKKKLVCNAGSKKASADPAGSTEAGGGPSELS